jgi:signal recognition particle subunit SRP54
VHVFAPEPGNGVGNPVKVSQDSIQYARDKQYDVVVVDTAGRLGIDQELMKQAADIRDAVSPDEILFVVDAMIGQDAVTTAQAFLDGVGFDGVVLTKLDGDARGGAALSVAQMTGRQVMFASNGEKLEDFDVFHPDRMASRILGMGDVLSLIEQAEQAFDAEQSEKMARKIMGGDDFTLEDLLVQMEQMRKLGSMQKILGMMPGMAEMRQQINSIDEKEIDRVGAIVKSMTPAERQDPKILNGSRRARIARGSGVSVSAVNNLVDRFFEMQKQMRSMSRGGFPGIPGMPGFGAGGGRRMSAKAKANVQAAKKKNRSRSGNPVKRAAEEQARAERAAAGPALPAAPQPGKDFELPDEFKKMLG